MSVGLYVGLCAVLHFDTATALIVYSASISSNHYKAKPITGVLLSLDCSCAEVFVKYFVLHYPPDAVGWTLKNNIWNRATIISPVID